MTATRLAGGSLCVNLCGALDGQVVALRGAGRKDDFLGVGADQRGGLLACQLDAVLRLPTELMVAARGVAELIAEVRKHGFHHAWVAASGGGMIEINREFECHSGLQGIRRSAGPSGPAVIEIQSQYQSRRAGHN